MNIFSQDKSNPISFLVNIYVKYDLPSLVSLAGMGLTSPELPRSLFIMAAIEKLVILFFSELFELWFVWFNFLTRAACWSEEVTNEATLEIVGSRLWADWLWADVGGQAGGACGCTAAAETAAKFVEIIYFFFFLYSQIFFERSLLMFGPQLVGKYLVKTQRQGVELSARFGTRQRLCTSQHTMSQLL